MSTPIDPRQDIDAIRDYLTVESKAALERSAAGRALLAKFATWYASVSRWDLFVAPNEKVGEAKWYRNEANRLLKRALPQGWISADSTSAIVTAPPTSDPTPTGSVLPWVPLAIGGGVVAAVWYLVHRLSK